jgi:hypothetical protein
MIKKLRNQLNAPKWEQEEEKKGYPVCGFPQSHQANAETLPQITPWPLPSISSSIHYSLLIVSLDAI